MPTLQQAIAEAAPGDTIVLAAGTYPGGNVVPAAKRDITIRGVDRNEVVLDGEDARARILVRADGVSILNLSAHNFRQNAFYWVAADHYRASYLTWNVRGYGIYVEDSEHGVIDHSFVSGAADAAYYVGECRPCDATITRVVARLGCGVFGHERDRRGRTRLGLGPQRRRHPAEQLRERGIPPEARTTIVGNTVIASGRARCRSTPRWRAFLGIGIAVAGGNANAIRDNRVTRSERYGIAVFPTARFVSFSPGPEPGPPWRPRGNRTVRNVVSGQRLGRPRPRRRLRTSELLLRQPSQPDAAPLADVNARGLRPPAARVSHPS